MKSSLVSITDLVIRNGLASAGLEDKVVLTTIGLGVCCVVGPPTVVSHSGQSQILVQRSGQKIR